MGFREDVSIRVRSTEDGARIDARSASRYFRHDFGSNASRLKSLLEDIDTRLSADAEKAIERRPQPKPPAGKPAPTAKR
jgi:uncharacterized protein (DUF1499 family)